MTLKASWKPSNETIKNSNIHKMMLRNGFDDYEDFWKWSVNEKLEFWSQTIETLNINLKRNYSSVLSSSENTENSAWLKDAKLNIVDSCFQNNEDYPSITYQNKNGSIESISQGLLKRTVNQIANGLKDLDVNTGDFIAICMPMTVEAVAIYLAAIKAGNPVVTIADSFTVNEIEVRLALTKPKVIFTQINMLRMGKTLPMYEKITAAKAPKTIVIKNNNERITLREGDIYFSDFKSENDTFESVIQNPYEHITVLFSSGTTGEPKAIPWNHTTPIKGASDGFYHQNIQKNDVVCWPTNLGWMMGPWLVFATLINKATIALYYDAPLGVDFGKFVQEAKVNMLGVIPSIVRHWKNSKCMESLDWSEIKCFSSTGEVSNPKEMEYLMDLGGNKPVIEYCGGTEIGGGYVSSTVVQPNIASTFSTQTLGGEFILLDEEYKPAKKGEMFLLPPIMGLSTTLLHKDHHDIYYRGLPKFQGKTLRRHGDELEQLSNGYFRAHGRADDAMNLGGIKVSSIQIEEVINQLDFVKESAAIAIPPKEGGPSALVIYFVECNNNYSKDERFLKIIEIIKTELNPLFKVSRLIQIEGLPRTASGKVMRKNLRLKN
jgi:acetyl-CoA synthetase